jgi:hypothetical protein
VIVARHSDHWTTEIIQNSSSYHTETHYISATKPNRLMLFRERVIVYCENHAEHTNSLCGQNPEHVCKTAQYIRPDPSIKCGYYSLLSSNSMQLLTRLRTVHHPLIYVYCDKT